MTPPSWKLCQVLSPSLSRCSSRPSSCVRVDGIAQAGNRDSREDAAARLLNLLGRRGADARLVSLRRPRLRRTQVLAFVFSIVALQSNNWSVESFLGSLMLTFVAQDPVPDAGRFAVPVHVQLRPVRALRQVEPLPRLPMPSVSPPVDRLRRPGRPARLQPRLRRRCCRLRVAGLC